MRQINVEKDDPLKRIQAEINEVERRESELREKKILLTNLSNGFAANNTNASNIDEHHTTLNNDKDSNDSVSAMSDDSGISSSSSPINGQSSNPRIVPKYVRAQTLQNGSPSSIGNSANPPMKLARAMSTPQIFIPGATGARFNVSPAQKGIMQRFIASRGRIGAPANASATANGAAPNNAAKTPDSILTSMELNRPPIFALPSETVPPIIQRDECGRPVRRGYIPVEEKIQKELRDLRSRESELKRIRRNNHLRQSQPDLLDDIDDSVDLDSGEDSEEEHCFMPGKLRASKSIGELCDSMNSSSLSSRDTPSPQFNRSAGRTGLKPAMSLAQLCDVEPEEALSSHRLIAQWENIIQQNQ